MSVHVGYTVTDNTVPQGDSGPSTLRLTQSYTPTKSLQITVMALLRHHGVLLWFGENLGLLDDTTPQWLRWIYDPNPETTDIDEEQQ